MESKAAVAVIKNVRVAPRKARLIIDLVRGRKVSDALAILKNGNTNKKCANDILKAINSASGNAVNNLKMNSDKLYISSIFVNDGVRLKRMRPRAKGNGVSIIKRTSHISVFVKEVQDDGQKN
ncbi:MAG: 50S ribosomal protein L22 [Bacilli bacterium]|nr:50S ribosomal protein L22 [Bacilli bacterium]